MKKFFDPKYVIYFILTIFVLEIYALIWQVMELLLYGTITYRKIDTYILFLFLPFIWYTAYRFCKWVRRKCRKENIIYNLAICKEDIQNGDIHFTKGKVYQSDYLMLDALQVKDDVGNYIWLDISDQKFMFLLYAEKNLLEMIEKTLF